MAPRNNFSDENLLSLLKKGDNSAFTEIYDRYWEKMANYAIRLTRSEEEGADIVQEIFVSIWNRRDVLEVKDDLAAYLIKSTRNLSLRYIERNLNKHEFLKRFSESWQNKVSGPADLFSIRQLQRDVDTIVEKLPNRMREIYILSRNEQLSHREIATKLGIAETTVKKQINNALKILSKGINDNYTQVIVTIIFLFFK